MLVVVNYDSNLESIEYFINLNETVMRFRNIVRNRIVAFSLSWISLAGIPYTVGAEEASGKISSVITGERTVRVIEISVDKGDDVKKGDILAKISTEQLKADRLVASSSLEEARAVVKVAEARLAGARLVFDRQSALKMSVSFRRADLEDAEVALQLAQSNLLLAKASVTRQQAEIDRIDLEIRLATIVAPFDGTIAKILTNVGATVTQNNPDLMIIKIK